MCGIWALIRDINAAFAISEADAEQLILNTLENRGPEGGRVVTLIDQIILGFTRLAINGLTSDGMQPFHHNGIWTVCNGEIYNYKAIAEKHGFKLKTGSDCEVLPLLYEKFADSQEDLWNSLDGVFAAIIVDTNRRRVIVARDPYGVRPLFYGTFNCGSRYKVYEQLVFGSEMKSINSLGPDKIQQFPPGHYINYDIDTMDSVSFIKYHKYSDNFNSDVEEAKSIPAPIVYEQYTSFIKDPREFDNIPNEIKDVDEAMFMVRAKLEEAVHKRMLTERPVAALLSGGIDSSLIAALVARELRAAGAPPLKTFSIGFEGSEDLKYARMVADHIGSDHNEIVMTPDDFFAAIPEVIKDIESFDTTTVRASVGNWLVAREIRRRTDCKVVFNGDGSDEVFGSYMYFYKAPSDAEFDAESIRLLKDICYYDVLRSDRSISSHGLEPRTPFLDKGFVATAHRVSSSIRRPIIGERPEKWILRAAFADRDLLPDAVLWRKKEAFSDGVSGPDKLWYQNIQERLGSVLVDEITSATYEHMMPSSDEDYYYRYLFEKDYTGRGTVIPYRWMPRWIEDATDPSARTLQVYAATSQ
jgi:asparagine synthase (glutamine-hydrolysing)